MGGIRQGPNEIVGDMYTSFGSSVVTQWFLPFLANWSYVVEEVPHTNEVILDQI